jgi:hypothetical protein
MRRLTQAIFCGVLSLVLCGCGDSKTAAPVAEQDELKKYAAENPHDDSQDAGVDDGGGN